MADDTDTFPTTIEQLARMPDYRREFWIRHWEGEPIDHVRLAELVEVAIHDEFEKLAGKVVNRTVYFVQTESGPIKIGIAQDVQKRLRGLQVSTPDKLTLLCTAPGGVQAEAKLHRRFASYRLRGEWFAAHPDILAEVERIKSEYPQ